MRYWWSSLSGEARAAIIAAIVSPVVAELLGLRVRMIRWFYIRTLEKLKSAQQAIENEFRRSYPEIIPVDNDFSYPIEQLAERAGIWKWQAKRAVRWRERIKEFGNS